MVFANEQEAEDAMEQYSSGMNSTGVEDCLQEFVEQNVESGSAGGTEFTVGEVDVGQFNVTPPNVDESAAWQVVIPVEITSGVAQGLSPSVYLELVVLRDGDTVASVNTSDVLTEFDAELRDQLVQAVAGRMASATD